MDKKPTEQILEDFIGEVIEVKEGGNPVIKFYNPKTKDYLTRHISQDVIPFKIHQGMMIHYQGKMVDEKPSPHFSVYEGPTAEGFEKE